jgi:hypothetical protein
MSQDNQIVSKSIIIPGFQKISELHLDLSKTREAEIRLVEAKMVNPSTYADLSYCFNESYRELRNHHKTVSYQITIAEKAIEIAKADVLLDKYPAFMEGKPKGQDNADMRKAFIMRDEAYLAALDRLNMLRAMESYIDGNIKVMERTCSYLNTQINVIVRSGLAGSNIYNTQGKK